MHWLGGNIGFARGHLEKCSGRPGQSISVSMGTGFNEENVFRIR